MSGESDNRTLGEKLCEMKFGPCSYTPEQAAFIREVVKNREPLPERPAPVQADADSGAANPPHEQEGTQ